MKLKRLKNKDNLIASKGSGWTRLKRKLIKAFIVIVSIIIIIAIGGYIFMQHPQFGKNPTGKRLEIIKKSPNYIDGKFRYTAEAAQSSGDFKLFSVLKEFVFSKSKRKPPSALPAIKTDLKNLKPDENVMVWFGHSSYFLQIDGKKILIDPVLSGNASPVKLFTKSYKGADIYTAEDIPDIDYLIISHDHFDHLDYNTVKKIRPRVKKVIAGLGIGEHFEYWGYESSNIIERDWNESIDLGDGFEVTVTPARHRSGRSGKSNQTLWASFVIKTPSMKIYYSGDSGYGPHFSEIGNNYGPFDLALMECGQYSQYWKYSHMMPEEVVQASLDLKTEKIIPGHWSKFSLSLHDWDEPIIKVIEESKRKDLPVIYPKIGEKVDIRETVTTEAWWESIR